MTGERLAVAVILGFYAVLTVLLWFVVPFGRPVYAICWGCVASLSISGIILSRMSRH